MKLFKPALIVLITLFSVSVLAIIGIALITFSTDGGGFAGSELLVEIGFGSMLAAIVCPVLIVLLFLAAWIKRRSEINT
ncbi:hypothetical protein [Brevibacterium spongiae]|uniref:Uncharacterized protein n=1 Tax=Brevibacterium spongiae TaxID=2909672 RepID=A0ABY5SKH2_9MICO|nr:hypothetical protein [Brevibacterium spongiae]UVI34780.1 hypothetical protein L1F31_11655 [Brevibacterium spongiae]